MPAVERLALMQDAVLWPAAGYASDGEVETGKPQAIKCRYVIGRTEALDPAGRKIAIDAKLTTAFPVAIDSLVFLGLMRKDFPESEKLIVKTTSLVPDVLNVGRLHMAGLAKHNNAEAPVQS